MKEKNKDDVIKNEGKKFNIFNKKEIWISGLIGLVLGGILIYLLGMVGIIGIGNEVVVKFNGGKVTKNSLYNEVERYSMNYALDLADKAILDKIYRLTDEEKAEVEHQAESILNTYGMYYGYTEEEFLDKNGFESREKFIEYMELDYKRNLWCIDYFKTIIPSEEIQEYYENNVYGTISTKHILVEISDDVTDNEALATANEILAKLKSGKDFDEVSKEYKDKVVAENVSFDYSDEDSFAEEYITASKNLEKDQYTTEAVKTDFGYHIIYCIDKKSNPTLEEAEKEIIEVLANNLEEEDQYIRYKALVELEERYNLKFKNNKLQKSYKNYCDEIKGLNETIDVYEN